MRHPTLRILTCLAALPLISACATSPATAPVAGEVAPKPSVPCFPGAYYRKAVSSIDVWTGFEGVVVLPAVELDPARPRPNRPGQFKDNPSVYIGGWAGPIDAQGNKAGEGREIDAGLSWEVVREPDGKVSQTRRAFRPFWRNATWVSGPADPNWYFYPGDAVRMRIETRAPDKLTLTIELVSRGPQGNAELERYAATRPSGWLPKAPPLVVEFDANYFGPGHRQEFKRVNAIDQVGREGQGVEPTRARALSAEWTQAHLLRGTERLPFSPNRFTDMRCPDPKHHQVTPLPQGGERLTITGTP